eukprot:CAMPEP_0174270560 /NCGR_PEP_ID=MMETSP0439-20130205/44904_1 /TAXON_ID=0 /ORGANISM="Stereomyxa ramosa, Strain Chinc5" /LENGTH=243 /DNA_ID=CAMNT_0015359965 /DNA_START=164 /DNA_END=892 /DNA_ORIENTATION=+
MGNSLYYKGEWYFDSQHGFGKLKTVDGIYSGNWVHGIKHGKGRFVFLDGTEFNGTYKDDERQWGITKFSENIEHPPPHPGKIHEGGYKHDWRHGLGFLRWEKEPFCGVFYEGWWESYIFLGMLHIFYFNQIHSFSDDVNFSVYPINSYYNSAEFQQDWKLEDILEIFLSYVKEQKNKGNPVTKKDIPILEKKFKKDHWKHKQHILLYPPVDRQAKGKVIVHYYGCKFVDDRLIGKLVWGSDHW